MATLKREVKKLPSEQNLRLLSSLIVSIANKQSSLEDKCIAPWKADETYQKDISYVSHNGYVYICSVTNQDSVFTESHWTKLADEFTELDVDTIKSYLNLTPEQITTLQSLIDDTTITTTKTNSSSKIYMDIQAAIAECKDDTLKQIAKKVSGSYKIATSTAEVTSADHIYLISNGSNYDLYVLVDSVPTKVGDTSIDLSDYAKLTDLDNYYDKATSDGKFATITTVDNHINDIVAHLTQDERDKLITTDKLLKIANDTYIEDADNPTSTICKSNGDTLNTPFKEGLTNASISLIISVARGSDSWNGQISISMASNNIYVRNKGADGWCRWAKFLMETDIITTINSSSTDTQVPSAKAVETRVNKVNKCTVYSNEDLNLITEPGLYACVGGDTYGATHNFPVPDNGYLQHIAYPADGYCMQTFVPNGVWGGELNMYVRRLRSGVWSSWQRLCGTTIADVPMTYLVSEDSSIQINNGTISVKNGICYISLWDVQFNEVGQSKLIKQNLPKTNNRVATPIIAANDNGEVIGYAYVDDGLNLRVHVYKKDFIGYGSLSYPVAES